MVKISILVMIKIKILVNIKINLIQKKLLNHLKNCVINLLNLTNLMKSIINLRIVLKNLNIINLKKEDGSVSLNQRKIRRYARDLKDIVDLYNLKSDSDTSKKGEGLKILTNKQMLNRLPILLAQIQAGNNSKSLKNEARQILYLLYRSKVLTKTVYNNLIKSIRSKELGSAVRA